MRAVVKGNNSDSDDLETEVINSTAIASTSFNAVAGSDGWTEISGVIANGDTSGPVKLRFASDTWGQTSTVYALSYVTARRIQ